VGPTLSPASFTRSICLRFVAVIGYVMLAGFFSVFRGMGKMAVSRVGLVAGLFMMTGFMMFGCRQMVLRGVLMMLGCLAMMLCCDLRHVFFSSER
jgi:hypothetical protein